MAFSFIGRAMEKYDKLFEAINVLFLRENSVFRRAT